jgi:hypothetical protein
MFGGRGLTFSAHIALEFLVGLGLAVAPFVFDFDDGATIVSLVLGVATLTAALSTSVAGHAISFHHALDRAIFFLLLAATVISAIAEIDAATATFAAAAAVEGMLLAGTRYTPEPTRF